MAAAGTLSTPHSDVATTRCRHLPRSLRIFRQQHQAFNSSRPILNLTPQRLAANVPRTRLASMPSTNASRVVQQVRAYPSKHAFVDRVSFRQDATTKGRHASITSSAQTTAASMRQPSSFQMLSYLKCMVNLGRTTAARVLHMTAADTACGLTVAAVLTSLTARCLTGATLASYFHVSALLCSAACVLPRPVSSATWFSVVCVNGLCLKVG